MDTKVIGGLEVPVRVVDVTVTHFRIPAIRKYTQNWAGPSKNGVEYHHKGGFATPDLKGVPPRTKGGATLVQLMLDDGRKIEGQSTCSVEDNFNYRLGRTIALGRAVDQYRRLIFAQ